MPLFRTCRTCAATTAPCERREAIRTATAGLGLTSIKHRCPGFAPVFKPGDPVTVEARAWIGGSRDDDEGESPFQHYAGHFVGFSGARLLVFIAPLTPADELDGYEFEPSGNGFVKSPLARVKPRNGERVDVTACSWCAQILGLGQSCARDPNYTPSSQCLANLRLQP